MAFAESKLISSKNIYSKFSLPTAMLLGDKYNIPITVVNNHKTAKSLVANIKATVD